MKKNRKCALRRPARQAIKEMFSARRAEAHHREQAEELAAARETERFHTFIDICLDRIRCGMDL
ncbi:MAG: hypothetical protein J6U08_05565 [Paludibacteraceae bacterium]|nr:hypothetical protein [Paludibacteraceae bacterium]